MHLAFYFLAKWVHIVDLIKVPLNILTNFKMRYNLNIYIFLKTKNFFKKLFMKKLSFLFLSFVLVFTACKKDDIAVAEFYYDGENQSAPYLDAGTHDMAARFTANSTRKYEGRILEEVEFYILTKPSKVEVRIFGQGTATEPGDMLYSKDVTAEVNASSWNHHKLDTPVVIKGEDLWICIRAVHDDRITSLGCDVGPANDNGDWIKSDSDNQWKSLRERTNQSVNINWNVRGHLLKIE